MKKFMTLGLVAVMAAGGAMADDGVVIVDQTASGSSSPTEVTAEAALMSAYVWRGQVYNNDAVFQPQVTISHYDFSLNVWGNFDLGQNNSGNEGGFSEIDFSLAYTLPMDLSEISIDVGLINYTFPNAVSSSTDPDTTELFVSATVTSWKDYFIPSVTGFGDVDEVDGTYFLFDVAIPVSVSDVFAVDAGASAGWGNTSYNDAYWGYGAPGSSTQAKDSGWNDYNVYANASYELMENVTLSANLTYTWLDGTVRKGGNANYEAARKVWGGVNVAYDF
jgi:hypothetical protein